MGVGEEHGVGEGVRKGVNVGRGVCGLCVNVGVGEGVDVAKGGDVREWVRVWVLSLIHI